MLDVNESHFSSYETFSPNGLLCGKNGALHELRRICGVKGKITFPAGDRTFQYLFDGFIIVLFQLSPVVSNNIIIECLGEIQVFNPVRKRELFAVDLIVFPSDHPDPFLFVECVEMLGGITLV
jgi:hypothetical protein